MRLEERLKEIAAIVRERLSALDWYRALQAENTAVYKQLQEAKTASRYFKFEVGYGDGLGSHVLGEGDTWEEAFKKADEFEGRKAAEGTAPKTADVDCPF